MQNVIRRNEPFRSHKQQSFICTPFVTTDESKRLELADSLLAYCKLDTLAMVQLYQILHKGVLEFGNPAQGTMRDPAIDPANRP